MSFGVEVLSPALSTVTVSSLCTVVSLLFPRLIALLTVVSKLAQLLKLVTAHIDVVRVDGFTVRSAEDSNTTTVVVVFYQLYQFTTGTWWYRVLA